ncbi:MAG: hypothetical protein HY332_24510 [Chloroflexi bacterium]|nr:hypothetical protein [Chloroflexota bacterium]
MVESDTAIDWLNGQRYAQSLLRSVSADGTEKLGISLATYGELLAGVRYGRDPKRSEQAIRQFLRLAENLPVTHGRSSLASTWPATTAILSSPSSGSRANRANADADPDEAEHREAVARRDPLMALAYRQVDLAVRARNLAVAAGTAVRLGPERPAIVMLPESGHQVRPG